MLRTRSRSGIGSMNMGHKEQKGFIAGPATKTVSILKSETIEMRNDRNFYAVSSILKVHTFQFKSAYL